MAYIDKASEAVEVKDNDKVKKSSEIVLPVKKAEELISKDDALKDPSLTAIHKFRIRVKCDSDKAYSREQINNIIGR